jgi:flagellar basal-body rod protein FlgG
VEKVYTVGDLQRTGSDLDFAIEGDGFFQVELPDGETAYTRDGSFKKDSEGRLVTSDGNPVLPEIVIPENSTKIAVGKDGTIMAFLDSESVGTEIGTLELARFGNPSGLLNIGNNMVRETDASGAPILGEAASEGFGGIAQGFLESSNVSIMQEMIELISGQRAYEINSKAVRASDEILQQTTQLVA